MTQCKLTAGVDAQGNVTALHMRISGQSILAGVFPQNIKDGKDPAVFQGLNPSGPEASIGYSFPDCVDHAMRNPHVPPGFWRGVNLNQNTIYLECFIDEVAHATGQDPLALRRKLMASHPKHLAVLNAVAERVGWDKPPPKGVYRGLAQTMGFGSYVAACAEVSVSDTGALKIHRIVAATDPGHAVNPQQIEAQVEGSFAYGLSAMLYGECTVKDGRIEQTNFDTYRILRMDEMPAGGDDRHAVGRLLGRCRRADDRCRGAGRAERDLRRDRQAYPRPAAQEPEPEGEAGPAGIAPHRCSAGRLRCVRRSAAAGARPRSGRRAYTIVGDAIPAAHDRRRETRRGAAPSSRTGRWACACCATRAVSRGAIAGHARAGPRRRGHALVGGPIAAAPRRLAAPESGHDHAVVLPHRSPDRVGERVARPAPCSSAQQIEDVVALLLTLRD